MLWSTYRTDLVWPWPFSSSGLCAAALSLWCSCSQLGTCWTLGWECYWKCTNNNLM